MWNCPSCGCRAIAASLTRCPMCGEEKEVPKITNSGPSNSAAEVVDETRDDIPAVEETAEPDPEAAKQKAREAKAALKDGDHEKAAELLDEAAELHPERAEYFAGLKQKVAEAAEGPEE